MCGNFSLARWHVEQALSFHDPENETSLLRVASAYPTTIAKAELGLALVFLGLADRAAAYGEAAVDEGRRLVHPPTLAISLAYACNRLMLVGANAKLKQRSEELVALATEQGYPHYRGQGAIYLGWSKVANGEVRDGISTRDGLSAYRDTGATGRISFYMLLLARAHEIEGQLEEALAFLEEPFRIATETGERWVEAELNRQKGQLLLSQGHAEAAEELYRQAISIAQEQEAKFWELRAAISLARLWGEQGRHAEAHELLTPVYGWFTEGFDTADLKEAKAFLENLAKQARGRD
jgi:predicted ATPase